jgi:hypothetical protein
MQERNAEKRQKFVEKYEWKKRMLENNIKPLYTELNPICHLLALAGAHHFVHVTRVRVKVEIKNVVWNS